MGIGLISLANFAALRERWALGAFLSNSLDGKRPNSVVTRICKTRLSLRYCLCSPGFVVRGGELAPLHPSKPGPSSTSICCYSWAKKGFNSPQKYVAAGGGCRTHGGLQVPSDTICNYGANGRNANIFAFIFKFKPNFQIVQQLVAQAAKPVPAQHHHFASCKGLAGG